MSATVVLYTSQPDWRKAFPKMLEESFKVVLSDDPHAVVELAGPDDVKAVLVDASNVHYHEVFRSLGESGIAFRKPVLCLVPPTANEVEYFWESVIAFAYGACSTDAICGYRSLKKSVESEIANWEAWARRRRRNQQFNYNIAVSKNLIDPNALTSLEQNDEWFDRANRRRS